MPPAPWPRRILNAIPPMPDTLWVGFFLFMVFMCGVILGLTYRDLHRVATVPEHFPLQHQLNSLEQRVRTLEQRQP